MLFECWHLADIIWVLVKSGMLKRQGSFVVSLLHAVFFPAAAAAAESIQSCRTLCDPIVSSPPGSAVPGILQARTLEWVAISFSNAWKWKVKVQSLSHVRLFETPWTAAHQAPPSMGFSRQEYWSGVPLPSPVFFPRSYSQLSPSFSFSFSFYFLLFPFLPSSPHIPLSLLSFLPFFPLCTWIFCAFLYLEILQLQVSWNSSAVLGSFLFWKDIFGMLFCLIWVRDKVYIWPVNPTWQ